MAIRIQIRRDTAATWTSANPVLLAGELGIETDTLKIKIGNGTNWNDITSYANTTPENLTNTLSDYILVSDRNSADGVAGLDSSKNLLIPGSSLIIEGSTDNAYETILIATDPTSDRTITFPDASGTVVLADGSGNISVSGNLTVNGTTTTVNSTEINVQNSLKFEGATDNAFETNITVVDPTADRTITFQDASGTVAHISNVNDAITTANNDATTKANDAVATSAAYTDGQIDSLHTTVTGEISTHNSDTTGVHGITDTAELATKLYADSAISTHNSDTTNVHGIADTSALTTKTYVDNLVETHALLTTNVHGIPDTSELATQSDLSAHNSDTGNVHGIADTSQLITTAGGTVNVLTVTGLAQADTIYTNNLDVSSELTANNLTVDGNLVVNGTTTTLNTLNINLRDNLIYLNEAIDKTVTNAVGNGTTVVYTVDNADNTFVAGNVARITGITPSGLNSTWAEIQSATTTSFTINKTDTDTYLSGGTAHTKANINPDLGFVGGYNDGTYAHAGLVRDASSDGLWRLFSGVTTEPSSAIDFSTYTRASLEVGALFATGASIGDVTNQELQFVHGVTSAIQTQINAKAPSADATFTGVIVLPSTTSIGNVSSTEIGYLDGVTSAIQTQINAKSPIESPTFTGLVTVSSSGIAYSDGTQTKHGVPSITPIITKTADYTLSSLAERDTVIEVDSTSDVIVTIPTNSAVEFPVGTSLDVTGINTGLVTIAGDTGVTVNATPGLKLRTQWSSVTLFKRGTNSWVVYGDLKA